MPAPAQTCSDTSELSSDRIPDSGWGPPVTETDLAALYRGPLLPEAGLSARAGWERGRQEQGERKTGSIPGVVAEQEQVS